jgi:hypothetical protein
MTLFDLKLIDICHTEFLIIIILFLEIIRVKLFKVITLVVQVGKIVLNIVVKHVIIIKVKMMLNHINIRLKCWLIYCVIMILALHF